MSADAAALPPPEEGVAAVTAALDAPPAAIFAACTTPGLLTRWLAVRAAVEPRAGGRYDLVVMPDALEVSGVFVDFVPARGFLASWEAPGVEESLVELAIESADAGGSRVTLRHRGLPSAAAAADYADRWTAALGRLAHVLSGAA